VCINVSWYKNRPLSIICSERQWYTHTFSRLTMLCVCAPAGNCSCPAAVYDVLSPSRGFLLHGKQNHRLPSQISLTFVKKKKISLIGEACIAKAMSWTGAMDRGLPAGPRDGLSKCFRWNRSKTIKDRSDTGTDIEKNILNSTRLPPLSDSCTCSCCLSRFLAIPSLNSLWFFPQIVSVLL